jgi:hypothetical protein
MPGTEVTPNAPASTAAPVAGQAGGKRHKGVTMKTLKKVLKKAGLKVSGKKATLTRRAKKAKLMGGAEEMEEKKEEVVEMMARAEGASRGRSRSRSRGFRLY